MYNGGVYGRIKTKATPFNVRVMQQMAHRIANISLPAAKYSIFDKLREKNFKQYGNFGMANDPRKNLIPPIDYLGTKLPQLPEEMRQERVRGKTDFESRADALRKQAGARAMTMPMMGGAAAPGIATPQGGQPAGSETVDDTGWNVTLSQIVGSGMLSQQQLQSASFNNVYSMINATGMTESTKREMTYYLQRMILEGYIRGVDMVREIKSQNGGKINIGLANAVCGSTAYDGCGDWGSNTVTFRAAWWNGSTDKLKLALFYHELGHAILNRPHNSSYSIMQVPYNQISGTWQTNSNYKTLVDELFRNNANSKLNVGVTRGNIPLNQAMSILNGGNPGPLPPSTGPNTTPINPTTGQPDINIMNSLPPMTNITNNYTPPQINEMGGGGVQGPTSGGGYNPGTPKDAEKTPVAGMLPDMNAVHTFAAGLQDTMARGSSTLQGLAGAITKFKHG